MTSRFAFVASSALIASVLVFAAGCTNTVDVPLDGQGDDGGDGGDGGDGSGDDGSDGSEPALEGPLSSEGGDCPSNLRAQDVCQPDVPVASVAEDCDFGVGDNQCQPSALEAAKLADCPGGSTDGLCDVVSPAFTNWACPAGASPVPGLRNANGSTLSVEGVNGFTACQTVWAESCGDGSMPVFGSSSCQNVAARACPAANDWPSDANLRASVSSRYAQLPIVFVRLDGAATGDGALRTAPVNFAAGLTAAAAAGGAIIALANGDYVVPPTALPEDTALVGGCASQTTITADTQNDSVALIDLGNGAAVAELTLTGSRPGVSVNGSGDTLISHVQILDALATGVSVTGGGRVALSNVSISNTQANPQQLGGNGLSVSGGSSADLAAVALVGNRGAAISVAGAQSSVNGTGVVVLDTLAAGGGGAGQGASVSGGGNLDLTQAVFANNRDAGVAVQGAGSGLSLLDTVITATASAASGTLSGAAVSAAGGAQVTAQRLLATDNVVGLRIAGADSALDLRDSIIADPSAPGNNAASGAGAGLIGEDGPVLGVQRVALLRNRSGVVLQAGALTLDSAVVAGSTGAAIATTGSEAQLAQVTLAGNGGGASFAGGGTVDLSDLRVVDSGKVGSDPAHALLIDGAEGTVARLVAARNAEYGVYVSGARANLDFSDVRISDTSSVQDAGKAVHGIAFVVTDPAAAPAVGVTRGIITQSHEYGVLVNGPGPQVFLTDVSISQTRAVDAPARAGAILFVNGAPATQAAGGLLALERVKLDDNVDSGASVTGPGIELDLTDVSITNTQALPSGEAAAGLTAQNGAVLSGTRVQLVNNAHTGVAVEGAGTALDLRDLVVKDTQPVSASGPSGEGLKVVGGSAEIVFASFLRNASAGVWAAQGASVSLSDVTFDETLAPTGGSGVGIDAIGSTVKGDRVTISNSHGLGLSASLGAQVTFTDVSISSTLAAAIAGRGVEIGSGSNVELNRVLIAGSPDYALVVTGPDAQTPSWLAQFPQSAPLAEQTKLALYDLSVHDAASGLAVLPGAALELDTFDIRGGAVGLQLVEGATVTAVSGNITSNSVGVNIQGGTSIDLTQALKKVVLKGNMSDSTSEEMPVPSLSDLLARSGDRLQPQALNSPR